MWVCCELMVIWECWSFTVYLADSKGLFTKNNTYNKNTEVITAWHFDCIYLYFIPAFNLIQQFFTVLYLYCLFKFNIILIFVLSLSLFNYMLTVESLHFLSHGKHQCQHSCVDKIPKIDTGSCEGEKKSYFWAEAFWQRGHREHLYRLIDLFGLSV